MMIEKPNSGLGKGDFQLFLQPKHDAHTHKIIGAESLSRFLTDEGEIVMPCAYIDEFEQNGTIKELDFYMLEKVCVFLFEWSNRFGHTAGTLPVSVNFSKTTLESETFLQRFEEVVNQYGIDPGLIEIEITELHRFHNYDLVTEMIDRLRHKGFMVSIDDYGKNSSAFSIIRHVDVDVLKVDREMTVESEQNFKTAMIFENVVKLAKQLRISVVAEGVETKEQLEMVKNFGCDVIQGWYFSKALPVDDFAEYVKSNM